MRRSTKLGKKFILTTALILFPQAKNFAQDKKKPLIIAHRGASGYLPEHSLLAATMAHAQDADYVELDLVLTKDSVPIVLHDITLDSSTDVQKKFPKRARADKHFYALDFSLKELKRLMTHERTTSLHKARYQNRFPSEILLTKIPTLDEMVQLISGLNKSRKKNVGLYIEIKSASFHEKEGFDITQIIYDSLIFHHRKLPNLKIILQSFEKKTLKKLKHKLKSKWPLIQLIYDSTWGKQPESISYDELNKSGMLKVISSYADGLGPWITSLLKETKSPKKKSALMTKAQKLGLMIHPYTLRKDELPRGLKSSKELLDFLFKTNKMDGVFTDFPDLLSSYSKNLKVHP